MLTYRAQLRLRSATLTPWQADTLFGHLCWMVAYYDGEAALQELLEHYREMPPLLVSNGFPGRWLPCPLLRSVCPTARCRALPIDPGDDPPLWVSFDQFELLRRGLAPGADPVVLADRRTVVKARIDRRFGTALDGPGRHADAVYTVDEHAFGPLNEPVISVYLRVSDAAWAARAETLLRRLAQSGYGAKKSAGYGQFTVSSWEPLPAFDEPLPHANGFISLSNWVPARNDPTEGRYLLMVKRGRLGEAGATGGSPFKHPLLMLRAGSVMRADAPIRPWYGRLVADIAPGDAHVVQYGYAFAVPALFDEQPTLAEGATHA